MWLNDDGDIIMPLGIAEITAASAALGNFWREFDRRTNGLRMYEDKYAPAGRIARAIYRETIQEFLWRWEGTDADFREPAWPTQWTHEFPLALGELLTTLERETAMLAAIAGTTHTDSPGAKHSQSCRSRSTSQDTDSDCRQPSTSTTSQSGCVPGTSTPQPV